MSCWDIEANTDNTTTATLSYNNSEVVFQIRNIVLTNSEAVFFTEWYQRLIKIEAESTEILSFQSKLSET